MNFNRRSALVFCSSFLVKESFGDEDFIAYDGIEDYSLGDSLKGSIAPSPQEISVAGEILTNTPRDTPFNVFNYLLNIKEKNIDNEPYNQRWKKRYNPLIVEFFSQLGNRRITDEVPWCAASLSWAINRCSIKSPKSARSYDFRNFGTDVSKNPEIGDIVVFKSTLDEFKGHVGIFIENSGEDIKVLGGNQIHGKLHKFSITNLKTNGPNLELHSIRRIT